MQQSHVLFAIAKLLVVSGESKPEHCSGALSKPKKAFWGPKMSVSAPEQLFWGRSDIISWAIAACRTWKSVARWGAYCTPQMERACLAFLQNCNLLSVSNFGLSGFEHGQTPQTCNTKFCVEQNITEIDGIVEHVLDRNGEETSKSCGVSG